MIKVKVHKTDSVTLKMSKGDYRLIRLILDTTAATTQDSTLRAGLNDLILPYLPAVIDRPTR